MTYKLYPPPPRHPSCSGANFVPSMHGYVSYVLWYYTSDHEYMELLAFSLAF